MSQDYAESRIREALRLNNNNATKARQQIIAWAAEDQRLLLTLARPHLTGIVAHAVGRVVNRQNREDEDIPDAPQSIDMPPETFGMEIIKALQNRETARFGRDGGSALPRRKQASQSHIDALKKMAKKSGKDDIL